MTVDLIFTNGTTSGSDNVVRWHTDDGLLILDICDEPHEHTTDCHATRCRCFVLAHVQSWQVAL